MEGSESGAVIQTDSPACNWMKSFLSEFSLVLFHPQEIVSLFPVVSELKFLFFFILLFLHNIFFFFFFAPDIWFQLHEIINISIGEMSTIYGWKRDENSSIIKQQYGDKLQEPLRLLIRKSKLVNTTQIPWYQFCLKISFGST